MQITAQLVKELRDKTGAGMLKCKEALVECKGNVEEAVDFLRKKGLASADKRSGRATSQGLVVPITTADRRRAAIVEVNCETDFVARNEDFVDFANKLAKLLLETPGIKQASEFEQVMIDGQTVEEFRKNMIAKTGENISINRAEHFEFPDGAHGLFDGYIHGDGNIAVLVQVATDSATTAQNSEVLHFAHESALQAAAMKPHFTHAKEVPTEVLAREREVILGQIKNDPKNADKPEDIVNKIVEGRLSKYYQEYCLNEQTYVKDDNKTIGALADEVGKSVGGKVNLVTFRRWATSDAPAETSNQEENSAAAAG